MRKGRQEDKKKKDEGTHQGRKEGGEREQKREKEWEEGSKKGKKEGRGKENFGCIIECQNG